MKLLYVALVLQVITIYLGFHWDLLPELTEFLFALVTCLLMIGFIRIQFEKADLEGQLSTNTVSKTTKRIDY